MVPRVGDKILIGTIGKEEGLCIGKLLSLEFIPQATKKIWLCKVLLVIEEPNNVFFGTYVDLKNRNKTGNYKERSSWLLQFNLKDDDLLVGVKAETFIDSDKITEEQFEEYERKVLATTLKKELHSNL